MPLNFRSHPTCISFHVLYTNQPKIMHPPHWEVGSIVQEDAPFCYQRRRNTPERRPRIVNHLSNLSHHVQHSHSRSWRLELRIRSFIRLPLWPVRKIDCAEVSQKFSMQLGFRPWLDEYNVCLYWTLTTAWSTVWSPILGINYSEQIDGTGPDGLPISMQSIPGSVSLDNKNLGERHTLPFEIG